MVTMLVSGKHLLVPSIPPTPSSWSLSLMTEMSVSSLGPGDALKSHTRSSKNFFLQDVIKMRPQ